MAISNTKIIVKETLRNESTRKTIVALANKSFTSPFYATKIRRSQELDIFCDNHSDFGNIPCLFFDIYNVNEVQQKREVNLRQKTLFGETIDRDYLFLKENFILLIDPCTELFYNQSPNREKYKAIKNIPILIKNMLKKSDVKTHYSHWTQLIEGKHIQSLATWYAKYQSENNADIIIPPSPLIDGVHDDLINYAIEINRKTSLAAEDIGKPSALYFLINYPVFANSEMFSKLSEDIYDILIEDDEELSSVKLIIFKIKNYQFEKNGVARNNFKSFLSVLGTISRNTERGVLLLDADSLGLIALFNNIDGYVEPLNEKIQEQWGTASNKTYLGKYYHPELLESLPFEDVKRSYEKSNRVLPCSCPSCQRLNGKNIEKDRTLWNISRKIHKLYCRNQEIKEVIKAMENNEIRGISNKLSHSSVPQYKDILTNGF